MRTIQNLWSDTRLPLVSMWRTFNTSLDFAFYDTTALTQEERAALSGYQTPQGRILVVYPAAANRTIRSLTPLEFVRQQMGKAAEPVTAIVVAGVGSSALGTASLARDVANYLDRPVAGIVSGLGLADVATEALGGWFVFGLSNAVRDGIARTLDYFGFPDHVRDQESHDDIRKHFSERGMHPEFFIYGSPDSTALLYLLSKLGSRIKLLVGHSKGNLSIENALEGLHQIAEASDTPVPRGFEIVTLGAVIWFDDQFRHLHQFLGQMDLLGMINSRVDMKYVPIPGVGHSLNRVVPTHLSVAQALEMAGIRSH